VQPHAPVIPDGRFRRVSGPWSDDHRAPMDTL
jgi:hypothetical protein